MNRFWSLCLGTSLLFLTSCFDMLEEVHLNKDGSGKYAITMDMGGIFSNPFMKEALGEAMKSEGDKMGQNMMEMDTVINFGESAQAKSLSAKEQKLLEQVVMNMKSSEKEGVMKIAMSIDFSSIGQLSEISKVMKKVGDNQGEGNEMAQMFGGGQFTDFGELFALKGKKLFSRLPTPSMQGLLDDETKDMMSMLLVGASYKTIYHMPGKVKKSTIPNSEIDGSTVTVDQSLLDVVNQKVKLDGDIKYK